ncbi:hypothetical protein ABIA38_006542 [Embleya sp. AB8]
MLRVGRLRRKSKGDDEDNDNGEDEDKDKDKDDGVIEQHARKLAGPAGAGHPAVAFPVAALRTGRPASGGT